jgi:Secretion system C-terminal sorting domain
MNKILTLVSFCLISAASLFSQIDPFSNFKKNIETERRINLGFYPDDSVAVTTIFDPLCNPLQTIKSKWSYRDKKFFYQDKDSFSYVMVGNILRPDSKTYSIWRFDKQEWESQTRFTFNYANNNPYFVERISSVYDTLRQRWFKRAAESFLLDKNGNTLAYENYDPYNIPKILLHKVAYEYTDWGALKYFKRERPSNGDWRTDTIKSIAYDQNKNITASNLTTYTYDRYDNQLTENKQKDSISYVYTNGLLVSKRTLNKYSNVDSFFYNAQKYLTVKKTFYADSLGRVDTTNIYTTFYQHFNGKDLPRKKTFDRKFRLNISYANVDTIYWIQSSEEYFTYNANNQLSSSEFIGHDPVYDYSPAYSKIFYNYCGETKTSSPEIHEQLTFTINPNPVNQLLFIELDEQNHSNGSIQILDVLGNTLKLINKGKDDVKQIDVSNFSSGIYFLRVQMGNKIGVKKFVVNH